MTRLTKDQAYDLEKSIRKKSLDGDLSVTDIFDIIDAMVDAGAEPILTDEGTKRLEKAKEEAETAPDPKETPEEKTVRKYNFKPRVCIDCGKTFEPTAGSQKRCPECAAKYASARRSERAKAKPKKPRMSVSQYADRTAELVEAAEAEARGQSSDIDSTVKEIMALGDN